ncbi:MAG: zinc-binding alcohol dehydrogenase family protein [Christensenellales bacterium]|jgi:2-desacetyl-2-hydroxyethyl bacteriochlorophyllide A dehydrogenase
MVNNMMKSLQLISPYSLRYADTCIPDLVPGWTLLKAEAVCICGSDIHAIKGNSLLLTYPRVLGHEICARVVKANGESRVPIGTRVAVSPYVSCGECYPCRIGRSNCCTNLQVLGVHIDGAIAEYVAVPSKNLIEVPQDMDPRIVTLIEPLAVGVHAVNRGKVCGGDDVLVLGAGPIGLCAAEAARIKGANTILADVSAIRREFSQQRFDYHVLDVKKPDFINKLKSSCANGDLPNVVIDATGNAESMNNSLDYLRSAGRLVFVGLHTNNIQLSDVQFHVKEATLFASRVALPEDFSFAINCVSNGKIPIERMLTHETCFDNAKADILHWVKEGPNVFKGVIMLQEESISE